MVVQCLCKLCNIFKEQCGKGENMEIVIQTIRIIDYENNNTYTREIPETFSDYVRQLITYINSNNSIRDYRTRSVNTEVISCILDIIKNQIDEDIVTDKINSIAERLLLKEREAQTHVANMDIKVQKGSLIQSLLHNEDDDTYIYLLAKVEHIDFVDDEDFSFKSGFSKDTKKLWKSCIFEIDNLNDDSFLAKVYSNNTAKYWYDNFLELNQVLSNEVNTDKAFRAIDAVLNRLVKNTEPKDHTLLRNSLIVYFKSNDFIDYDTMIKDTFESYHPIELKQEKLDKIIEKLQKLPEKYEFDRQFNTVSSVINAKIRKIYDVCHGVQLKITDGIDDLKGTIIAYREPGGNRYIKIKTDNDITYNKFSD